jgi:hypothetical protein
VIPGKSLQDDHLRVAWHSGAPYAAENKSTEAG